MSTWCKLRSECESLIGVLHYLFRLTEPPLPYRSVAFAVFVDDDALLKHHAISLRISPYSSLLPTLIRVGCRYLPYRVLIPAVSDADTCPGDARSQFGPLQPPQRRDSAFCRLRAGCFPLRVSASQPVLRTIFGSGSLYLLMLLNISQPITVAQREVMIPGRPRALHHLYCLF